MTVQQIEEHVKKLKEEKLLPQEFELKNVTLDKGQVNYCWGNAGKDFSATWWKSGKCEIEDSRYHYKEEGVCQKEES